MKRLKVLYSDPGGASIADSRPSITEVTSRYTNLRKSGHSYVGLCPFHSEKTPSFNVNEEKAVFYCHGCHVGGDVIAFIQKIEELDFKAALSHLGMSQEKIPSQEITRRMIVKAASDSLARWALDTSIKLSDAMREIGNTGAMAVKVLGELGPQADTEILKKEIESRNRQWAILEGWQNDLFNPLSWDCSESAIELWRERAGIESIAARCAA